MVGGIVEWCLWTVDGRVDRSGLSEACCAGRLVCVGVVGVPSFDGNCEILLIVGGHSTTFPETRRGTKLSSSVTGETR